MAGEGNGKARGSPGETVYRVDAYLDQDGRKIVVREPVSWPGMDVGEPRPPARYRAEFFIVKKIALGGQVLEQKELSSVALDVRSLAEAWLIFETATSAELAKHNRKIVVPQGGGGPMLRNLGGGGRG